MVPRMGYRGVCPNEPHAGAHAGASSALTRARKGGACERRYRLAAPHPTSRSRSHLRRTERRASNLPPRGLNTAPSVRRAKPRTWVVYEVLTAVCCLPSHGCVARACCALSASPRSASWHDSCRAIWQIAKADAHCVVARACTWPAEMCSTLYGTCHHAVRRVQLARPAYAAFSTVSSATCARSSAMPAGSLSSVLGVSTAAPKGEIVPKWECLWLSGSRQVGMRQSGNRQEWKRGVSGNGPKWDRGVSGIPSLRTRESVPALGSSDVRMPRAPRSATTVRS
jgi:hypothetical protein